ncbi:hypothetical protein MASR2M15_22120 [Anaerolineales bacterium]
MRQQKLHFDAFISYSRKDTDFCHRLYHALLEHKKDIWVDFDEIPPSADWWKEIQTGIEGADAFIFIISPVSARSEVCGDEIAYASGLNKRLIPILHQELSREEIKLIPSINAHNWIFMRNESEFEDGLSKLIDAMETDLEFNRTTTRLLVRAQEWQSHSRSSAYLLRGDELEKAQLWLLTTREHQYTPTDLHVQFIESSRLRAAQTQRSRLILMSVITLMALILTMFALFTAERARVASLQARSLALSVFANQSLNDFNPDLASRLAYEALETDPVLPQAYQTLAMIAYSPGTIHKVNVQDEQLSQFVYDPVRQSVWAASATGSICLWSLPRFEKGACIEHIRQLAHTAAINALALSPDARYLASADEDGTIRIWDTHKLSLIRESHADHAIRSIALAHNGLALVYGDAGGNVALWTWSEDNLRPFIRMHGNQSVDAIAVDAKSFYVLSGDADGTIVLWNIFRGAPIQQQRQIHNEDTEFRGVTSLDFKLEHFVSAGKDQIVRLWSVNRTGFNLQKIIRPQRGLITDLKLASDKGPILIANEDTSIISWNLDAETFTLDLYGDLLPVQEIAYLENEQELISLSDHWRYWRLKNPIWLGTQTLGQGVTALINNPTQDAFYIQSDKSILRWDRSTNQAFQLVKSSVDINGFALSKDANTLYFANLNGFLQAHDTRTGSLLWGIRDLPDTLTNLQLDTDHKGLLYAYQHDLYRLDFTERKPEILASFDSDILEFLAQPESNLIAVSLDRDSAPLILYNRDKRSEFAFEVSDQSTFLDLEFDPTHRYLAASTDENLIVLWDIATLQRIQEFSGHVGPITDIIFTANNTLLSSAEESETRLWDIKSGLPVYRYTGSSFDYVNALLALPSGQLVTASIDGVINLWDYPQPPAELLPWTEEHLYLPELSCLERRQFNIEPLCAGL